MTIPDRCLRIYGRKARATLSAPNTFTLEFCQMYDNERRGATNLNWSYVASGLKGRGWLVSALYLEHIRNLFCSTTRKKGAYATVSCDNEEQ